MRRLSLALLGVWSGCTALNPAFEQDGSAEAEGLIDPMDTDAGGGTASTTRDSATSSADGSSTSDASDATASGSQTWGTSTEGEESGGDWTSGSETSGGVECTFDPIMPCTNTLDMCLPGQVCAPWPEGDHPIGATYCFPAGPLAVGAPCDPVCGEDVSMNCGEGLVCDTYSGELTARCRASCGGPPNMACDTGVCLEYELAPGVLGVGSMGFCRGECDPVLGGGCEPGSVCALEEGGLPICVEEPNPVALGGDCTEAACQAETVCVPGSAMPSCPHDNCCAETCFPTDCTAGSCVSTHVVIPITIADSIRLGFCEL